MSFVDTDQVGTGLFCQKKTFDVNVYMGTAWCMAFCYLTVSH